MPYLAKTEHSHPLGMVVSTHFHVWKHAIGYVLQKSNCLAIFMSVVLMTVDLVVYVQKATRLCLADIPPKT